MVSNKEKLPIKDGLFTWPTENPQLIIAQCSDCGELVFPKQDYCPECCTETMEETKLSSRGEIKCFTGINAPTPGYKGTVPYTVGIVEFPEGIRILGVTTEKTVESLSPGMKIEVIFETAYVEDGQEYITYKYKPIV
jgi:uncharacterized protein